MNNSNCEPAKRKVGFVFLSAVFASLYALTLAAIPDDYFNDRSNYLSHIDRSIYVVQNFDFNLKFFFSEPLFYIFNALLSALAPGQIVISLYVWFVSFTFCFFVLLMSRNPLMALLGVGMILFTPNLWGLQLGAIRQGVVASLVFWGFFFFRYGGLKFLIFSLFLGFIHLSGFLLFIVFVADYFSRFLFRGQTLIWRGLMVSAVLLCGWLAFVFILPLLDPKHSQYADRSSEVGGGLFLFYFVFLFAIMIRQSRRVTLSPLEQFGILGVLTYLAMYFFVPIAGRWLDYFVLPLIIFIVSRCTYRNLSLAILFLIVNVYLFFNGGAESLMLKTFW